MPKMSDFDETPTANFLPTPAIVLRWIAASDEGGWFPSRHARDHGIPRDALDDPLSVLRNAGLIRVRDWVKGLGQAYCITAEGREFVDDPHKLAKYLAAPISEAVRDEPPTTFERGEEACAALLERQRPRVVTALVILNFAWFLVGFVMAIFGDFSVSNYLAKGEPELTLRLGGISGEALLRGEWWRLLTCAFVHCGIVHILLNMYVLSSLGTVTESIWGSRRFLVLYIVSAICASCLEMGIHPVSIGAGASGAIWGLLCSLLVWLQLNRNHLPEKFVKEGLQRLGLVLLISIAVSFAPGVGWAAHFAGGIAGMLIGATFVASSRARLRWRWAYMIIPFGIAALAIGGLVVQTHRNHDWTRLRTRATHQAIRQFLKSIESLLHPIETGQVDRLYRQTMDVVHLGAKKPELPGQIETLRNGSQEFLEFLDREPKLIAPESDTVDQLRRYALAIRDLADAMLDTLQNPDGNLLKLKERKRIVDDLRNQIGKPEKTNP